jgi:hypothetical protein
LDIAQSGRIHYVCFFLPAEMKKELDASFAEKVREQEFKPE